MKTLADLHDAIAKVCPISGIALLTENPPVLKEIRFAAEATQAQKDAAITAAASFDWNAPTAEDNEVAALKIVAAIDDGTPLTAAQVQRAVRFLLRQYLKGR